LARRTRLIIYIATYLLIAGTIIRYLTRFGDFQFWPIALSVVYLILMIFDPLIFRRNRPLSYIYLLVQIGIISAISILRPNVDFWSALFFPLILHVMDYYPQRIGFTFTGVFTVIMAILMIAGPGPEVGIPLILINGVVYFLMAAFIAIIREAESSNVELRKQQIELQAAHEQLQSYTTQAEELAVLQERNRLARELHDSVTQSLHSLTLLAEATQRLAGSGEIERARTYINRLGDISHQALKEMRLLVYELRPLELRGVGLIGALQQRLDAVERRSGVEVQLTTAENIEVPRDIEEELYRIAVEALNNALKHANPTRVTVTLNKAAKDERPCIELAIIDDGIGFEPGSVDSEGGLGLISMKERIEKLGGELTIISAPGEGAQVVACVNMIANSYFNDDKDA
jgi:signal transduction histidine kinase